MAIHSSRLAQLPLALLRCNYKNKQLWIASKDSCLKLKSPLLRAKIVDKESKIAWLEALHTIINHTTMLIKTWWWWVQTPTLVWISKCVSTVNNVEWPQVLTLSLTTFSRKASTTGKTISLSHQNKGQISTVRKALTLWQPVVRQTQHRARHLTSL